MAQVPQISEAEWEVMKIVWDHGPLGAGEVVKRLEGQTGWRPRTIKTLLSRLVKKGAVGTRVEDRRFLYVAKVSRDACRRAESRSFLSRVFDGAVAPAVVHFIESGRLSAEEIEQLKRILDGEGKS